MWAMIEGPERREMTEDEYIRVIQLGRIKSALSALREITPHSCTPIKSGQLTEIIDTLVKWEIEISESIEVESE